MNTIAGLYPPLRRQRAHTNLFRRDVIRTLLYYEHWRYPLTLSELRAFLPGPAAPLPEFASKIRRLVREGAVQEDRGYYYVPGTAEGYVDHRIAGERHARRMWMGARVSAHIIKRFPFVRGVFVSGDLSKNMTHAGSDVDFFIVTEPGRLWIARTLLVLFKKAFLFNSKKFFCLNSFVSSDNLRVEERNIYQATEIAQLKPLFNSALFEEYLGANKWIREYFPNFSPEALWFPRATWRPSFLQKLAEAPFALLPSEKIDERLMRAMERVWRDRYPGIDGGTRRRIFLCARGESRAWAGDFQERILGAFERSLREHGAGD